MANARGYYGNNGVSHVGQTVYVEPAKSSIGKWLLGAVAIGGAVLFARHQSQQIEQLYKTSGLPHQSFASSLRQEAGASLRKLTDRVRSKQLPEGKR